MVSNHILYAYVYSSIGNGNILSIDPKNYYIFAAVQSGAVGLAILSSIDLIGTCQWGMRQTAELGIYNIHILYMFYILKAVFIIY